MTTEQTSPKRRRQRAQPGATETAPAPSVTFEEMETRVVMYRGRPKRLGPLIAEWGNAEKDRRALYEAIRA